MLWLRIFLLILPLLLTISGPVPASAQESLELPPLEGLPPLPSSPPEGLSLPNPEDMFGETEGAATDTPAAPPADSSELLAPPPPVAPPPAPLNPLAPFEPKDISAPPAASPDALDRALVPDSDIESILLDMTKKEIQKNEGTAATDAETEALDELLRKEKAPRNSWWEEEKPFNTMKYPDTIYRKDYEPRNEHLPKAYDQEDVERWIFATAARGDVNGLRALLNTGAEPDPRNMYGNTPLIQAVLNGRADTARLLLARSADPNAQNDLGLTALHIAAYKGLDDVAKVLLQMGANPNVQNQYGFSPLEFAATNKHYAVAQTLITNGAARTSRFYSGMVQNQQMVEAAAHSKYGQMGQDSPGFIAEETDVTNVAAPSTLPAPVEIQDGSAEGTLLAPSPFDSGAEGAPSDMQTDGTDSGADGSAGPSGVTGTGESALPEPYDPNAVYFKEPEDDGVWKQTKGGNWTKVGGNEPPQGVGGVYWHSVSGVWEPLDPAITEHADSITAIKARLKAEEEAAKQAPAPALNDSGMPLVAPPPASMPQAKPVLNFMPKAVKPGEQNGKSIPLEVISDTQNQLAPPQGINGVFYHQVDGEWKTLDPANPDHQSKINALRAEFGEHSSTPEDTAPAFIPVPYLKPHSLTYKAADAPNDSPVQPTEAPVVIEQSIVPAAPESEIMINVPGKEDVAAPSPATPPAPAPFDPFGQDPFSSDAPIQAIPVPAPNGASDMILEDPFSLDLPGLEEGNINLPAPQKQGSEPTPPPAKEEENTAPALPALDIPPLPKF